MLRTLASLGELFVRVGRYAQARGALDEAAELITRHPTISASTQATLWATYGSLETSLGRYGEARAHFEHQSAVLGEAAPKSDRAFVLRSIAMTLLAEGRIEECEAPLNEAMRLLGPDADSARRVALLLDGAFLAAARKNPKQMETYALSALEVARESPEPRPSLEVFSLLKLAVARHALGNPEVAITHLDQARAISNDSVGRFHRHRAWIVHAHGRALHSLGKADEARDALHRALSLGRECIQTTGSGMPESERHSLLSDVRGLVDAWLSSVIGDPAMDELIATEVLHWHGQVLRAVHADRELLRAREGSEVANLTSQLVSVLERLDAHDVTSPRRTQVLPSTQRLIAERERLERELLLKNDPVRSDQASVRALSDQLAPDEALVQWFVWQRHDLSQAILGAREERMLAIVLRHGRSPFVKDLGPTAATYSPLAVVRSLLSGTQAVNHCLVF
jgi:tetratricopeptide (TPR) repeat protein